MMTALLLQKLLRKLLRLQESKLLLYILFRITNKAKQLQLEINNFNKKGRWIIPICPFLFIKIYYLLSRMSLAETVRGIKSLLSR